MSHFLKTVGWCLIVSVMGGCSSLPDSDVYKNNHITPPLDIPQELMSSTRIDDQMVVPDIAPTAILSAHDKTQSLDIPPDLIGSTSIQEQKLVPEMAQPVSVKEKPASRAQLTRTKYGQTNLIVHEDFARAWRRTGLALDSLGFKIEDRDRSRGVYFIFGDESIPDKQKEYIISLKSEPPMTHIVVKNKAGKIDSSKTAEKILTLLQEQLK